MIGEILKYSKEHSQGVIVFLLGLLVIGSTCGGIWINNLHDSLEQTQKIADERYKLIAESNQNNLSSTKLNAKIAAFDIVYAERQIRDSLYILKSELVNDIMETKDFSIEEKQKMTEKVKRTIDGFNINFDKKIDKAVSPLLTGNQDIPSSLNHNSLIMYIGIVSFIVFLFLYLYFRNKG